METHLNMHATPPQPGGADYITGIIASLMDDITSYYRRLTPPQRLLVGIALVAILFYVYQTIAENPATLIARMIVLVVAFTIHEFSHAWMADYFGDMTPRDMGRLTLNPLKHLDPLGSLLLLTSGFGWAKPVQVNPLVLYQASPSAMMWVALAGPVSNLLLALIGAIPFQFNLVEAASAASTGFLPSPGFLLTEFIWINLILMLFNLLPIAPLDGEKVAMHLLPPAGQDVLNRLRPYSFLLLFGLIFLFPSFLGVLIGAPANFLLNLLVQ